MDIIVDIVVLVFLSIVTFMCSIEFLGNRDFAYGFGYGVLLTIGWITLLSIYIVIIMKSL